MTGSTVHDAWLAERDMKKDWSGDDDRFVLGLGIYQINRPADRPQNDSEGPTEDA